MSKPAVTKTIHAVAALTGVKHVGDEHCVIERMKVDAMAMHDQPFIFHAVRDLQHRALFEQRLQQTEDFPLGYLMLNQTSTEEIAVARLVIDRNIGRSPWSCGERQPDDIGLHWIRRVGLSIERDNTGCHRLVDPDLQLPPHRES